MSRRAREASEKSGRLGRPPQGEVREPLRSISVRLDALTLEALLRLEQRVTGATTRGRRSILLRRLILEADTEARIV